MLAVTIAVQKHNGHATQTFLVRLRHGGMQRFCVQRLHQLTVCPHAFIGFYHFAVEHLGQDNMPVKQTRPVLVSDAKHVFKTTGGHQQGGFAFAFEQGVGGHCGAHAHRLDQLCRNRLMGLQPQQFAYALHRRIRIQLRVLAEQFVGV